MTEHTVGPLTIRGPSPGGTACDDGGDYGIIDGDRRVIGEAINKVNYGEYRPAKANARLWAAAWRLLEALEQIAAGPCCETPGCSIDEPCCDAMVARAAIASIEDVEIEDVEP